MTIENDPTRRARDLARRELPKRFYERVDVREDAGAFEILLDGRPLRTPTRAPLRLASRPLTEAIRAEWEAQGERIDPATMPATRLANTALDGVSRTIPETRAAIAAYAGSDLVCYRAAEPEALVARQRAAWDPVVRWAETRFAGRLVLAEGVMHVEQPAMTLGHVADHLARIDDPLVLAALHVATSLTGSAFLALALEAGALASDAVWSAAHVDEDWTNEQWGEDAEAAERRARRRQEFDAAALVLRPGATE